jgi:hypothetical protein
MERYRRGIVWEFSAEDGKVRNEPTRQFAGRPIGGIRIEGSDRGVAFQCHPGGIREVFTIVRKAGVDGHDD